MNPLSTRQKPIEITKLHPPGVRETILKMRSRDIASYVDPKTRRLKAQLCIRVLCPICEKDKIKLFFVKEGFEFVQCVECELVYVNPQLKEEVVSSL